MKKLLKKNFFKYSFRPSALDRAGNVINLKRCFNGREIKEFMSNYDIMSFELP